MDTMKYRGYEAMIGYEDEDEVLYGRVLGIRDVITFEGTCIEELKRSFQETIDDYLQYCEEKGIQPEKSYSGNFIVRATPELHAKLSKLAEKDETSLNQLVIQILENVDCLEMVSAVEKKPDTGKFSSSKTQKRHPVNV